MKKEQREEMDQELERMIYLDEYSQEDYLKETNFWKFINKRAKRKVWMMYCAVISTCGIVLTAAMQEWFFCIVCGLISLYLTYLVRRG